MALEFNAEPTRKNFEGFSAVSKRMFFLVSKTLTGFYLTYRLHVTFDRREDEKDIWSGGLLFETLQEAEDYANIIVELNQGSSDYLRKPLRP